jgi:hypothetical protein
LKDSRVNLSNIGGYTNNIVFENKHWWYLIWY